MIFTRNMSSKIDKLNKFVNRHSGLAPQGSKQWLQERRSTFGGSELCNIIGSGCRSVIAEKIGLKSGFSGNLYTDFGSLYETLAQVYIEKLLRCEVKEMGSCPTIIKGLKISPDGLLVTKHRRVMRIINNDTSDIEWGFDDDDDVIILIEIKNPYNRHPDGKVPRSYQYQIQGGVHGFEIVDYAIYLDCVTRRCALNQLHMNPLPGSLQFVTHKEDDNDFLDIPPARGIIGIYDTFHNYDYGQIIYVLKTPLGHIRFCIDDEVDVGALNDNDVKKFYRIVNKMTVGSYIEDNIFGRSRRLGRFTTKDKINEMNAISRYGEDCVLSDKKLFKLVYDQCFYGLDPSPQRIQNGVKKLRNYAREQDYKFIGYIPWKYCKVDIVGVPPDAEFVEKSIPIIESKAERLQKINESSSPFKEYHDLYGNEEREPIYTNIVSDSDSD